jgi:(2Fe-2S) ferredoxin
MEIKIDPADIDNFVKEALIKSAIGQQLQETIKKTVDSCLSVWDSPVKKIVQEHIASIIREYLVLDENRALILEAIVKIVNPKTIQSIVSAGVYQLEQRLKDNN